MKIIGTHLDTKGDTHKKIHRDIYKTTLTHVDKNMDRVHGEDTDSCACLNMNYRSRAITGHSQLVVPPP